MKLSAGDAVQVEQTAQEVNFDSITGPTYGYVALGPGNLASMSNYQRDSNPRAIALQGLKKAEVLSNLGISQALLPPLVRPNLAALYQIGLLKDKGLLTAYDYKALAKHLSRALHSAPHLLAACFAASNLWLANAAVVSPSADTDDGKVHFTPANMVSAFHRSLEADEIGHLLKQIFSDAHHFVIHDPLPSSDPFSDEGGANHLRLAPRYGDKGLNVFVYGREGFDEIDISYRFRPRQTRAASEAIMRLHGLSSNPDRTIFIKQSAEAINSGIFHNDVISTANLDVMLYHEQAFADTPREICNLSECFSDLSEKPLRLIGVSASDVSLKEAAATYLFNSQIVADPTDDGRMILIAPQECHYLPSVARYLAQITNRQEGQSISRVAYVNVTGSMRAGGGPACMRLRVVLNQDQRSKVNGDVFLTGDLLRDLRALILTNYRDHLTHEMFAEESFLIESFSTTRRIYEILGLTTAVERA